MQIKLIRKDSEITRSVFHYNRYNISNCYFYFIFQSSLNNKSISSSNISSIVNGFCVSWFSFVSCLACCTSASYALLLIDMLTRSLLFTLSGSLLTLSCLLTLLSKLCNGFIFEVLYSIYKLI